MIFIHITDDTLQDLFSKKEEVATLLSMHIIPGTLFSKGISWAEHQTLASDRAPIATQASILDYNHSLCPFLQLNYSELFHYIFNIHFVDISMVDLKVVIIHGIMWYIKISEHPSTSG